MLYINPTTTRVNIDDVNINSQLATGYWGPDLYPKPTPPGPTPSTKPLTFTCVSEEGGSVALKWNTELSDEVVLIPEINLEVSVNDSEWRDYIITNGMGETIELNQNDTVAFRGNNETLGNVFNISNEWGYFEEEGKKLTSEIGFWNFILNGLDTTLGNIKASGNIMSLLDKTMQRTDVPEAAFAGLFYHCVGLGSAPELPATVLSKNCYSLMFGLCHIETAPELPATVLAENCYLEMFTFAFLTHTPELPATTLAEGCYAFMFGCTPLTVAPQLPATTLAKACYFDMFYGCSELLSAPELPANTLVDFCYNGMFNGCSKLTELTIYADNISADHCLEDFLYDTADGTYGILHYDGETDYTPYLPVNWYVNEKPQEQPLTFISEEDNNLITLQWDTIENSVPDINIEVSVNNSQWRSYSIIDGVGESISLNTNESVSFRGNNETLGNVWDHGIESGYWHFNVSKLALAKGNIMSLLDKTMQRQDVPPRAFICMFAQTNITSAPELPATILPEPETPLNPYIIPGCYFYMFYGCIHLVNGPTILPATNLTAWCYAMMFHGCEALTLAPELPATTLAESCYNGMFAGCTSLTIAPELPATTLANKCYNEMFTGCTSLTTAPELPATTLAGYCYANMFNGCTSLTTAPELPATTLATNCYNGMFQDCASLTTAPELPATTLSGWCYYVMFKGCTSLTTAPELPATTLAKSCYYYMFASCTSLTTAPELPATTLAEGCYAYMFHSCISLTTAPEELPATTLADFCYVYMFYKCTSLITTPELPATTLTNTCYNNMFCECTSLTTAPELPATTLTPNCYNSMFYHCTSLQSAPELPATELADWCYTDMFYGCTSLTTAPELPATTLVSNCYNSIFRGCTSLTSLTIYANDISAQGCLAYWLSSTAAGTTGTLINKGSATYTPGGNIPENWAVETIA